MRCTFVAMGAENISIETLSGILKAHGHETALAYDQSLFDDKNYLAKPRLARLFDHRDVVVGQVLRSKPDMIAFSVMTPTYHWALDMARRIKRHLDVPVIFGGIHPTTCPEDVIAQDCVDVVCKGEGDGALLDLCNTIERGQWDTSIPNLWFKGEDGTPIQNGQRPAITNIDELPAPDKALFAAHVPIHHSYLAVTSRGCPFSCSFCSLSYYAEEAKTLGIKRLRERSVPHVIAELKAGLAAYDYGWVEFRNNTFTANRKWVLEFCDAYGAEIARPFLAFAHPSTMDREIAQRMKDAGCFHIQLGLESYSEWVREHILNRKESNDAVHKAVEAMEQVGLTYSLDYILGLPKQDEAELQQAAEFFIGRKTCHRISPFMLAYLPKLKIVEHGLRYGELTEEDVRQLESGGHENYMAGGSVSRDGEKLRFFKAYRVFFRLIPLLNRNVSEFIFRTKLFKVLPYLPMDFLLELIDAAQALRPSDRAVRTYAKNYLWWFISRFSKNHPAYWRGSVKSMSDAEIKSLVDASGKSVSELKKRRAA